LDTQETDRRFVGFHDPIKAPIPRGLTATQLAALRTLKNKRSLNDMIEDIFVSLVQDDPQFVAYLEATQGSEVRLLKKAVIAHSLRIVAKRYNFSRKQRKYLVGGEYVPPDTNGSGSSSNE
jgi:hypothetical protein